MVDFERSLAALSADSGGRTSVALGVGIFLLLAWLVWSARAAVSLYEVSTSARVEAASATAPLESPFVGRVAFSSLALGRSVEAGELLVELDLAGPAVSG
jgi:multidrug efflux pump subunit AcrA (membrane-fusion protein)